MTIQVTRCLALLAALTLHSTASAGPFDVKQVLRQMAEKQGSFNPEPLQQAGKEGLIRVLDEFFPDTAEGEKSGTTEKEIQDLLRQLGHDRAAVRDVARAKLIRVGRPFRELIEKTAKTGDADVRLRAALVLRAWQPPPEDTLGQYAAGFDVYCTTTVDRERLDILSRRLVMIFRTGKPTGGRFQVVRAALRGVVLARDDRDAAILKPLMAHKDSAVPLLILQTYASTGSSSRVFPQLVLDALASERQEFVRAALAAYPNQVDREEKKSPQVQRALRRIFEGTDPDMSYQASIFLSRDFSDLEAFRYILAQIKSKNRERALNATYWIGTFYAVGEKTPDEVLRTLSPLLASTDDEMRRAAAYSLANYQGEKVVKLLIPQLVDGHARIVEGMARTLLWQKDRAMLRRLLREAAEKHKNGTVRSRAKEMLDQLDRMFPSK